MKKVVGVLAVVITVLVVVVFGVAWYFSSLVLDGAEVKGEDGDVDKEVVSVAPDPSGDTGTIVYRMPKDAGDPATDPNTVSRVGLRFADGGYLQLDQNAQVAGREVSRSYTLLAGEAPAPGDLGAWDWPSFPDAEVLGLQQRDVTYESPLGPTPAIVVSPEANAPESDTWAVVIHGRNGSVREGLRITPQFAARGMTTMLINYRDDLKETGAPSEDGLGNFGRTEWADVEAAVAFAQANGAEQILLVGYSMGGAVTAGYLERAANTDDVVGTILVSPAVSFRDITAFGAEQLGVPTAPLAPVIWLAERITELRSDIDYSDVEYIDNAADWPVPALVTAASEDDLVPPESIAEFARSLPDGTFALFDGAVHTGEWNHDWAKFDMLVGNWLDELELAGR